MHVPNAIANMCKRYIFACNCKSMLIEQKYMPDPIERAVDLISRALRGRATIESAYNEAGRLAIEINLDRPDQNALTLTLMSKSHYDLHPEEVNPQQIAVLNGLPTDVHERLRTERVSFVDLRKGVVFLDLPNLLVDRTYLPEAPRPRITGDPFSRKRQLVLYALLNQPTHAPWTISHLAEVSGVHVATASRTVHQLEEQNLLTDEAPGRGRRSAVRVVDPRKLLIAWAEHSSLEENVTVRVDAPMGTTTRFLVRLPDLWKHPASWALTGQAGASLLAAHAFFEDIFLYVDVNSVKDLHQVARSMGWYPSPSGRIHLMAPKLSSLIWPNIRMLDDVWVVSSIQLVLDLWNYPLRGREQAEYLINMIMRSPRSEFVTQ